MNLTATAADNVGVAGVQFQIDGINIGGEDTSSPFSFMWDSTTVTNGSPTLSAIARDAARNKTTSSIISVNVSNILPDLTLDVSLGTKTFNQKNSPGLVPGSVITQGNGDIATSVWWNAMLDPAE